MKRLLVVASATLLLGACTTPTRTAEFTGGSAAWRTYLERNLNRQVPVDNGAPEGTYRVMVSFLISQTGNVEAISAQNNPGYGTAEEAVRVIQRSPAWVPAVRNGRRAASKQIQPITFEVAGD